MFLFTKWSLWGWLGWRSGASHIQMSYGYTDVSHKFRELYQHISTDLYIINFINKHVFHFNGCKSFVYGIGFTTFNELWLYKQIYIK